MAELVWTEESERWLRDIFEYIALDNPDAADAVITGIYDRAQSLLDFPESGYTYEGSTEDVRILLYSHYRIAYSLEGETIVILGVFHGALAIERYLI
ncbi:MAG: type II toxin-antitoxin system RelE/ParE family toxin [Proteobacteria bacterium]|jgi:plasmid stabilization system protein ParE|nr:type II toxin-antitoxin system RelE/ParE family toxin [Pseudomonadota bacterium]